MKLYNVMVIDAISARRAHGKVRVICYAVIASSEQDAADKVASENTVLAEDEVAVVPCDGATIPMQSHQYYRKDIERLKSAATLCVVTGR